MGFWKKNMGRWPFHNFPSLGPLGYCYSVYSLIFYSFSLIKFFLRDSLIVLWLQILHCWFGKKKVVILWYKICLIFYETCEDLWQYLRFFLLIYRCAFCNFSPGFSSNKCFVNRDLARIFWLFDHKSYVWENYKNHINLQIFLMIMLFQN